MIASCGASRIAWTWSSTFWCPGLHMVSLNMYCIETAQKILSYHIMGDWWVAVLYCDNRFWLLAVVYVTFCHMFYEMRMLSKHPKGYSHRWPGIAVCRSVSLIWCLWYSLQLKVILKFWLYISYICPAHGLAYYDIWNTSNNAVLVPATYKLLITNLRLLLHSTTPFRGFFCKHPCNNAFFCSFLRWEDLPKLSVHIFWEQRLACLPCSLVCAYSVPEQCQDPCTRQ